MMGSPVLASVILARDACPALPGLVRVLDLVNRVRREPVPEAMDRAAALRSALPVVLDRLVARQVRVLELPSLPPEVLEARVPVAGLEREPALPWLLPEVLEAQAPVAGLEREPALPSLPPVAPVAQARVPVAQARVPVVLALERRLAHLARLAELVRVRFQVATADNLVLARLLRRISCRRLS